MFEHGTTQFTHPGQSSNMLRLVGSYPAIETLGSGWETPEDMAFPDSVRVHRNEMDCIDVWVEYVDERQWHGFVFRSREHTHMQWQNHTPYYVGLPVLTRNVFPDGGDYILIRDFEKACRELMRKAEQGYGDQLTPKGDEPPDPDAPVPEGAEIAA